METVSNINLWLSNREHKHLDPVEHRNRRRHRASSLWRLVPAQNPRRYASLAFRWLLPVCCERLCRECHSDRVWPVSLADIFRYLAGSAGTLSVQTSCIDTDRNMRTSVRGDCRDNGGHTDRNGAWAESPAVVRKRCVRCASANPFNGRAKAFWPKCKDELKSITTIFSHNILYLFDLQQIPKTLTGQ